MTSRTACQLLAGTVLAATLVSGCSSPDHSPPTLSEIRTVLARQAAAVRQHDRAAFAADLDTAQPAAAFRAAQLAAFGNLIRLPLSAWSYRLEGRTDFHQAEARAAARLGTAAVIVRVALRYALRGVDRTPTSHDLWWTFVRQGGHVVLAADDSLANAGGTSWQGPWDFGRLLVLRGPHTVVLGHPADAGVLPQLRATVQAAVPAVTAVWGPDWSQDVAVVVPGSEEELRAQAGESSDVSLDVAAVAVSDGQNPLTGAVYGQRLIVNPGALARLSAVGRRIVIRHEITHIAAAQATGPASPQWLVEGFADYVGNLGTGQPVPTVAAELRAEVRRGRLPAQLPSADAFSTQGESAQAYEGAWLACRLIAQRAGRSGLVRFYRLVGASPASSATAVAAALRAVLHESTARFTAQWRSYLRTELG